MATDGSFDGPRREPDRARRTRCARESIPEDVRYRRGHPHPAGSSSGLDPNARAAGLGRGRARRCLSRAGRHRSDTRSRRSPRPCHSRAVRNDPPSLKDVLSWLRRAAARAVTERCVRGLGATAQRRARLVDRPGRRFDHQIATQDHRTVVPHHDRRG